MKKLTTIALLFVCVVGWSQGIEKPDFASVLNVYGKSFSVILEEKGVSKDNLFTYARRWVAITYSDSKEVIQMSDRKSGLIVAKGLTSHIFVNPHSELWRRSREHPMFNLIELYHILEIDVKDGKIRMTFTITDKHEYRDDFWITEKDYLFSGLDLNNKINQTILDQYNNHIQKYWLFVGQKKIDRAKAMSSRLFESMNTTVFSGLIGIAKSLKIAIDKYRTDDW